MRFAGWSALGLALVLAGPAAAESPNCAQARAIVEEVQRLYASGSPDHTLILGKLRTARDICPTLGDAWKYSYCSALALGNEKDARIYQGRAALNGISDLSCGTGPRAPAVPAKRPMPGYVQKKYALVIGIGSFQDPKITHLQFAAKDARDLASLLTDPRYGRFDPDKVTLLTDEKATRANILEALQRLILGAEEDDLVLVYVSSHGSPHQGRDLRGVGYIVTYDTRLESIFVDALEYEDFSEKAAMIKARRRVVFLDTCYSGQARPGEKALTLEAGVGETTAQLFLSGEGTYVITSSRDDEKSFESEQLQNSYFTYHLMAALRRSGEPPSLGEVFSALARDVPAAVNRDKGMPQHPQMHPADRAADVRIGVAERGKETAQ